MKRVLVFTLALAYAQGIALADHVPVGLLSFDEFIPASTTPGVNALDLFNYTGSANGPTLGKPYAADPLTFDNALLTIDFQNGASQVLHLGNISPGELLDSQGFPTLQFPSTDTFTSAVFTAILNPNDFKLSDGSIFPSSGAISATLTPSSGSHPAAGVDFAPIIAQSVPVSAVPEPSSLILLGSGLLGFVGFLKHKRKA